MAMIVNIGSRPPFSLKSREKWIILDEKTKSVEIPKIKKSVRVIVKEINWLFYPILSEKRLPLKNADHVDCRITYTATLAPFELLVSEIKRILKKNGTLTISLREFKPEARIKAFEEAGFKLIRKNKKPKTTWEKNEEKKEKEYRKYLEKRAKLFEKNYPRFAEHLKELAERQSFCLCTFKKIK